MQPSTRSQPPNDAVVETLTASRALLGVIARSLATVMDTVTLPQFRVLVVLSDFGPLRMGELSEKLGANQSSFSRFADRMVTAGLIARQVGIANRREVIITLTGLGRDIHDTVTEARRAEIATLLGSLSPAERQAVKTGFEVFAGAAGEPPAADLMIVGL